MSSRKTSEIYVLQVAQLRGEKLGFEETPEGAWVDHDVFFDRAEAEQAARVHETAPVQDAAGRDITHDVVITARVVTVDDMRDEFGQNRVDLLSTMFRERIVELMAAERRKSE